MLLKILKGDVSTAADADAAKAEAQAATLHAELDNTGAWRSMDEARPQQPAPCNHVACSLYPCVMQPVTVCHAACNRVSCSL